MAAPATALPTRGPVQLKLTMASVAAMKKMPIRPPRSALASTLLAQLVGSWISKAPRKLTPKTMSNRKRKRLK